MPSNPPRIVVVGSLNIDYIASVGSLPMHGQTVAALKLIRRFGGKGANQAMAAVRQGARVILVGRVGADDEGRAYRRRLMKQGIDVARLKQTPRAVTGTALIAVDKNGENTIIVASGANGELSPRVLPLAKLQALKPHALLVQFEIPLPSVQASIRWANHVGVAVVLNPSPWREGFPWGKCSVDTLIANEGEAKALFGMPPKRIKDQLRAWREALAGYRIEHLVVTRGEQPTYCLSATEFLQVPTLKVRPVDTVGAGDAFAGAFAAHRAQGMDLLSAIRLANCAGALTTLKQGAQEAIPNLAQTKKASRRLL